jgi:hypothetical protein
MNILSKISPIMLLSLTQACATVASNSHVGSIASDGKALKTSETFSTVYDVGIEIDAPADKVWKVLTDSKNFAKWNSTVISLKGDIKLGKDLVLKSTSAPDRDFNLNVSTFVKNKKMVWEDGTSGIFKGVRTYTLSALPSGKTKFTMSENFAGAMYPMIKGALPDFKESFTDFAKDLKSESEKKR